MRLAHLHLPHTTPFGRVSHLQQTLTTRLLAHKKLASPGSIFSQDPSNQSTTLAKALPPPPDPTIITFTPNPVYTTGRRDLPPSNTSPPSTTNPTLFSLPPALEPIRSLFTLDGHQPAKAEYHPTLRGGQTTYHGPGQMVAYTILDLKRLGLTPRCHIRVLENSVIDLLKSYGVEGFTTEDPGVWVQPVAGSGSLQPRKITAVGVHLRRNISSFGIGLNVTDEPMWFFKQIVACGLEGKEATSLQGVGVPGLEVGDVAAAFVEKFVNRVNADFACGENSRGEKIDEVYRVREEDLLTDVQH
ncbi:Octanoyltransferase [Penicillium digitatum]|uniref:Octanoyltransferase n=3 Tax=Penicillium digitatum TaxID=36651 RepID=K9GB58_PEND2|nr:Octanoyltransferase [Penicillium digitatum Pd1]EKV19165.1 Octanoyltransferase [Penicillium digitatum PHI26]EKV21166.1 Octanoyltransferase [Penicillium digitatum Pd1]QQK48194.1 Octanoyltransferase [Penicillium digitatum]